jgi:protein FrlC
MARIEKNKLVGSSVQYCRFSFATFVGVQRDLGISAVDLYGSTPHIWCDREGCGDLSGLHRELGGTGIRLATLSPRPYGYSLCAAPGSLLREATLAYYAACIDAAALLSAPLLCLTPIGACLDQSAAESWTGCREALARLCPLAADKGVAIALGETPRGVPGVTASLGELALMIGEVGAPNLGAFLDTSVMFAAGETVEQWFTALGERIVHVRFVDGRNDGCRIWGEGCIPCGRTLDELGAAGYLGTLGLHLSGDRYTLDPATADHRNLAFLNRFLS